MLPIAFCTGWVSDKMSNILGEKPNKIIPHSQSCIWPFLTPLMHSTDWNKDLSVLFTK